MIDNRWLVRSNSKDLVSPYEAYDSPMKAGQSFTVKLVNVVVNKDLDGFLRGDNDILILTQSSLGDKPFVERVHFYEDEIPKGQPINNIFADNIFITDDYSGSDRLLIELRVLETDTNSRERDSLKETFVGLAETAGAVFPVVLPYFLAATSALKAVEKLVSAFAKDKNVIKTPFAFYPGEPRIGSPVLQSGTYVVFQKPQNGSKYKLERNGLLVTSSGDPVTDVSYAVFNIFSERSVSPNFIISQKVATLLTQMKAGNPNNARGALEFLNETLVGYANFMKLRRYLQLKRKASLTSEENGILERISEIEELSPFLPQPQ